MTDKEKIKRLEKSLKQTRKTIGEVCDSDLKNMDRIKKLETCLLNVNKFVVKSASESSVTPRCAEQIRIMINSAEK